MCNVILYSFRRNFCITSKLYAIKNITIFGAGIMGTGIAQLLAQNEQNVILIDLKPEILKKARTMITRGLSKFVKRKIRDKAGKGKFLADTMSRIKSTTDFKEGLMAPDLIIETITENLQLKQKLFATIDEITPATTIFATNTSSLNLAEICKLVRRRDRFIGVHFLNPAPMIKLVEITKITETSDDTYKSIIEWMKYLKKFPIDTKDTAGFIVNRLVLTYMIEAIRMYERGDATLKDIDTAMKLGAGFPIGPIELADFIGLDSNKAAMEDWNLRICCQNLYAPLKSMAKLVKEGKLGRKTGEGYYKYYSKKQ